MLTIFRTLHLVGSELIFVLVKGDFSLNLPNTNNQLPKRFLIFVSRDFPYGFREPYIEDEVNEFALHYHKVFLMVPYEGTERRKEGYKKLPDNVVVIQFPVERTFLRRLTDLQFLFTRVFWTELIYQNKEHHIKINRHKFRDILGYLGFANYFRLLLKRFLKSNRIPFKKVTFYSYHLSEYTLGMIMLGRRYKTQGVFSRFFVLDDELHQKFSHYQPFRRFILQRIKAVFSVSGLGKQFLFDQSESNSQSNFLVHRLGVKAVEPIEVNRENGVLKILTISFLEKYKRIALLVEALEMAEHLEIDWHHVGDGNDHQNIKQYAFNHLFNKPNVKFRFTADVNSDSVYEIIRQDKPHVFVCVSQHEDIPVSILEALSFGIPVITARVGAVAEVINDRENGLLLSANPSPEELVNALSTISNLDTNSYKAMSSKARQSYLEMAQAENNYGAMIYDMVQLSNNYEK